MICLDTFSPSSAVADCSPSPRLSGHVGSSSETEKADLLCGAAKGENEESQAAGEGLIMGPSRERPELTPYYSESWFTAEGARLKARRLKRRGVPSIKNWRFITLTIADRTLSPRAAYELGKDRLRRFFARWRKRIGAFRWLWKLEFHHDEFGFPHWHVFLEYKKRLPHEALSEVEKWWGLGRTKVQRVDRAGIEYLWKYVAKGADDLPVWVQQYKGRMRVVQTCKGFFEKSPAREAVRRAPRVCMRRTTILERMAWDARRALVAVVDDRGAVRVSVVKLPCRFARLQVLQAQVAIRFRRVQASPGAVSISLHQYNQIRYEHRKYCGLGLVPQSETFPLAA